MSLFNQTLFIYYTIHLVDNLIIIYSFIKQFIYLCDASFLSIIYKYLSDEVKILHNALSYVNSALVFYIIYFLVFCNAFQLCFSLQITLVVLKKLLDRDFLIIFTQISESKQCIFL